MIYAKIQNNTPVEWPVYDWQIRRSQPDVSMPERITPSLAEQFGFELYEQVDKPDFSELVQEVQEATPIKQNGKWVQQWNVVEKYSQAEKDQILADDAAQSAAAAAEALQQEIVDQTQQRLDEFARTRGYDNILSACTYADSAIPSFAAEGNYCRTQRDATWVTLLGIMNDVKDGLRSMPSSYADIEPELPVLQWP